MNFWNYRGHHTGVRPQAGSARRWLPALLLVIAVGALSACGSVFGPEVPEPAPAPVEERQLQPTWTPTPIVEPTPTPEPPTPTPVPVQQEPAADPQEAAPAQEEAAPAPTDPPAPAVARLTVSGSTANVRRGPGTNYGVVGAVSGGMSFDILGKNPAGDWYQFCCVNGEQGWIFAQLVQVENAQLVAVAQNIPAPPPTNPPAPVAAAPPPAAPPPAAPPPPQPEPQPEPQPQPSSDPCANIGGDGCKFRVTGGPRAGNNGGMELKLQLFFIHGGVDGGQPQGSYFIALEKDGQRLPVPDSVRSIALQRSEGSLGPYNYEYKLGSSNLPGGSVAGNYVGWVLDGNGERDSQNFSFSLGSGEGEVWIQFDQS